MVNVTNGKVIRLLVDDEPFDIRYGELLRHERRLDLRTGLLTREVEWRSPTGGAVRVRSRRLVSFTQRSIAAISYEVEPLERAAAGGRAERAGGQRAGAAARARTRARRRRSPPRCAARSTPPTGCARSWCT